MKQYEKPNISITTYDVEDIMNASSVQAIPDEGGKIDNVKNDIIWE